MIGIQHKPHIRRAVAVVTSLLSRRRARVLSVLFIAFLATDVAATQAGLETHQRSVKLGNMRAQAPPPARLFNLRVCSYNALSANGCTKDQRATILTSTRIGCSVEIAVRRRGRLHARMTYGGATTYGYSTRVLEVGVHRWWIAHNLGTVPLPGGDWSCQFSFGSGTARVNFKSGGPVGQLIGAAACGGKDTILFGSNRTLRACRPDRSGGSIPVTDEIVCSAVLPNSASKELTIQLLLGGVEVVAPYVGRVDQLLWIARPAFNPPLGQGTFAVGDYVCRFSLDGIPVAETPLHLAPS